MGNWDSEIDEVAERMIEGRPGPAFTAEVLSRLDAGPFRRRSRTVAWTRLTAVVVGFVLAIVFARMPSKSRPPALVPGTQEMTRSARGDPDAVGRPSAGTDSFTPKADTTSAAAVPPQPLAPAASRTVNAAPALDGRRVESLALTPIQIERLDVDAMEGTASIEVPALDIPALEVSALTAIARVDVAPISQD